MLDILSYGFMRDAFIIGFFIALLLPCIGLPIVLKRLSMIGDTLSHASLAGLTVGLVFGFNPILSAIVACVIAGIGVEYISEKLMAYQEIATVVILATAIGIAGIFSTMIGNTNAISAYLFGSIVTISKQEFHVIIITTIICLVVYAKLYTKIYLTVLDPVSAKMMNIHPKLLNGIITMMSALAISVSAKTIGSLIVSSILVIPTICAMQYTKTYKATLRLSILFSIIFIFSGLIVSYYYNLRPGAVIVLLSVVTLITSLLIKKGLRK